MRDRTPLPLPETLAPRYWPLWTGFGLLWLATRLPFRQQSALGRVLGRALLRVAGKRRRIAATNLRLCFPELDEAARAHLLRQSFEHLGQALLDTGLSWWGSPARLRALGDIRGMDHLQAALARGRGVILLTGHMTALDIGGQILALALADTPHPLQVMYKRSRNPLVEAMMRRGRERFTRRIFLRQDLRSFLRGLAEGLPTWYAPDQDFGLKQGVFAPFFGVTTATLTATARLAARSGAPVVPYFPIRKADGSGFEIRILPALTDFPSGDDVRDATRVNALLEAVVREHPAQYLWVHRRFKTQPPDEPPRYD